MLTTIPLRDALRPIKLDEVIGHDRIKPTIKKYIEQERTRWLFHGPTGTGKTSLAHIVAHGLHAEEIRDINGADFRVSDVRELVEQIECYPMSGTHRIIILDEAQALTSEVKSLLLKPLEDRRQVNVWILCTMDVKNLHPALRDRCESFKLNGMGENEKGQLVSRAAEYLKYTGNTDQFLRGIKRMTSAREILDAFEQVANGTPVDIVLGE